MTTAKCSKPELHELILRYSMSMGLAGKEWRAFKAHYPECTACREELQLVEADLERWRKDRFVGETLRKWFLKEAGLTEEQISRTKPKKQK